jgi:O-methyltransferase
MSLKLTIIRKIKAWFIRLRMHRLIEPFSNILLNLVYLSKISKWVSKQKKLKFNDFYAPVFDYSKRYKLYEFVKDEMILSGKEIIYLEFGVFGGFSFEWWVTNINHPGARFVGFDTFEGLPEDWGIFKKGDMNARVPQINDSRAQFVKGLFQETLPGFLLTLDRTKQKVILMDADLYSSTLYVLTSLAPYFNKGDIILFDEFNVPRHEFLAFTNFTESFYIKLELIGAANNYYFCAFEVQ